MSSRKQPELQPFYSDPDDGADGQVLDAVVVRSDGGGEKVLVSRWHLGITKRRILIQAAIILLAVVCLGALRLMTRHEETGAAGSTVRVEDTNALLAYRRDLSGISSQLSDRSRVYRQQSQTAASNRDLIGLFDAVNSYDEVVKSLAAQMKRLTLPHLANAQAQEFAAAAGSELKASLTRLETASLQMVQSVDRGEVGSAAFAAMQSAIQFADQSRSRQDTMLKRSLASLGNGRPGAQQAKP